MDLRITSRTTERWINTNLTCGRVMTADTVWRSLIIDHRAVINYGMTVLTVGSRSIGVNSTLVGVMHLTSVAGKSRVMTNGTNTGYGTKTSRRISISGIRGVIVQRAATICILMT